MDKILQIPLYQNMNSDSPPNLHLTQHFSPPLHQTISRSQSPQHHNSSHQQSQCTQPNIQSQSRSQSSIRITQRRYTPEPHTPIQNNTPLGRNSNHTASSSS